MADVTITATGASIAADNFTVTIIDYQSNSRVYNSTDTNKVSRTTLYSGYNVTGITAGDLTVRATSSGTCNSYADANVSQAGLQDYRPVPILSLYSSNATAFSFTVGSLSYNNAIATFSTYPYIDGTDFTVTYDSQSPTGGTANGPLTNLRVEEGSPGDFTVYGDGKSLPNNATIFNTTYRVTYNYSGLSRTFNFYWQASTL